MRITKDQSKINKKMKIIKYCAMTHLKKSLLRQNGSNSNVVMLLELRRINSSPLIWSLLIHQAQKVLCMWKLRTLMVRQISRLNRSIRVYKRNILKTSKIHKSKSKRYLELGDIFSVKILIPTSIASKEIWPRVMIMFWYL